MISVDEALEHVGRCACQLPEARVLIGDSLGLRLAEPIISEIDSPSFDKSMLDGYAVAANDRSPTRKVVEQVLAGEVPHHAVEPGTTINVMTGAPIPDGADAVVKHEDVTFDEDSTIRLPDSGVAAGVGVLLRGAAFHAGQKLLAAGHRLSPVDIALLAEVGKAEVSVSPRPRVAVLATGNELVQSGQSVGAGQICNSNGPMLKALVESTHSVAIDLGIGRDSPEELERLMQQGLEADILVVTGGVSVGVMDLVPKVFEQLGVEQVFHKICMRPGKPLWFGKYEQEGHRTLVFGLPGNPISTLVSFEIFVKPALRALSEGEFLRPRPLQGVLSGPVSHRGKRPTYSPCQIDFGTRSEGKPTVEPLSWSGSADLAAFTRANALAILPAGDYQLNSGQEIDFLSIG
ncbi:MAG: molybdopterin molybdotransferase MoeA [Planctomycetes bacterium]|nr:molybdopterin molybdotransferase MoeA [Planctomycetota bacterium]